MQKIQDLSQRMYEYIVTCCEEGVPPTVREICRDLHIKSTSTAHKYLNILEEQGVIERGKGQNRNIKVVGDKVKRVPLVGTVAAGKPITAIENIEGYIPYPYRRGGEFFALRVRGDSMIEAGIYQDDIVIVRKTQAVTDGDIVVALIEDEATVKTFFKKKDHFMLRAENPKYNPIIVKELYILGKVVSLMRDFE